MTYRLVILIFLIWGSTSISMASGILDRVITVEIKNTSINVILKTIEERAKVQFSYNPDLIDVNKLVSLSIKEKTIAFGLSLIFNKTVRFKEVGNHIILLKNEDIEELRKRKKSNISILFKGQITDKRTGQAISNASIYDIDARFASTSDANGNYTLEIQNAETVRSLYYRKKGYHEFVIVVDASEQTEIIRNISLEPELEFVEKLSPVAIEPIYRPIEERALSGGLVSFETYVHTENLEEIKETRIAQISLVPSLSIGSNLSTNGLITNNFSLNVLAGYSSGVHGAEVGGLLNMVKGDVKWFQAAGICNLVGGKVEGFQASGIINSVRNDFYGFQGSGILNSVGGDFTGAQFAGIANLSHQDFNGFQAAGISCISRGNIYGMQTSGIFSAARCGFSGVQLSGICSLSDSVSNGFQISGIHNLSLGRYTGVQLAGISNSSKKGVNLLQASSIGNTADENRGLQISTFFNHAKKNNGVQIGLVNISNSGKGLAVGLFNYVHQGYHKTEVSNNESFHLNLIFKSGIKQFYNTYNFGAKFGPDPIYAAGLGYGTNLNLKGKWSLSTDLTAQLVFENEFESFEFTQLYKLSTTIDYNIKKWVSIFAGPSINWNLMQFKNDEGDFPMLLGDNAIWESNTDGGRSKIWIGWRVGLRF